MPSGVWNCDIHGTSYAGACACKTSKTSGRNRVAMNANEIRAVNAKARVERLDELMAELGSSPERRFWASSASSSLENDPFANTANTGDYRYPSQYPDAQIPRHRWPDGIDPDRAALTNSTADAARYESFRRDQCLMADTADKLATKAAAHDSDSLSTLAKADPGRVNKAVSGPSTIPAKSAAEEKRRAIAAREKLLAMNAGYDLRWAPTGTFMRDAGNNSVQEFAYVILRISGDLSYPYYSGDLVGTEQEVHALSMEHYENQRKLAELNRKPYKPLVRVGAVQVADEDGNFPTQAEIEMNALRERLARLESGA